MWFQRLITAVIIFAGVLVGFETSADLVAANESLFEILNNIVLGIFIAEVVIKITAGGKQWYHYFRDPWNIFDFAVVVVCLVPGLAQYAVILRLARLLRVLRLISAVPKLQLLVGALLKSIPSMFYVSLLLLLLFYVYAVAAVFLFGANDPIHFGNLPTSLLSFFRAVTLEDWTDLMYIQMYGCDNYGYSGVEHRCTQPSAHPVLGALFFVSFILVGTMIVLNLFIGVIMNGMDEAQRERELEERLNQPSDAEFNVHDEIDLVMHELTELQERLAAIRQATSKSS